MYGTTAISLGEKNIKKVLQIAALMDLGDKTRSPAKMALDFAIDLGLDYAKNYIQGKTAISFCEAKGAEIFNNHLQFFEALCEEGVIEWLEPLVLAGRAKKSGDV